MIDSERTIRAKQRPPYVITEGSMVEVRGGAIVPPAPSAGEIYIPRATRRIKEAAELQQKRMEFWVLLALIGGFMAGHFMTIFALMEPVR